MKKNIFFVNVFDCPEIAGNLEKMFELLKVNGVSGLQIPYDALIGLDKEEFKNLLEKYNVELVCTHIVTRLCAKDDEIFLKAVKDCKKALEYIKFFDCKYFMPVPFYTADVDGLCDKKRAADRFAEGLDIIVKEAENYGTKVIIENISQIILPYSLPEDIMYLLEKVKNLGFCFDTGNFVCTRTDVEKAFEMLKDKIDVVHIKELVECNDTNALKCDSGIYVTNVDFGTGGANLPVVMKKLLENNREIPYIIEVQSQKVYKCEIEQACSFFNSIIEEK